jgi:bifunctional UDP-N-acetylglucosamine pyrophosphorylase / glucosamine-1-phosphate N-acetyltransferase
LGQLMDDGVTIIDPATTWIDPRATIGVDTVIRPFVEISGPARIGAECRIGPFVRLTGAAQLADHTILEGFGTAAPGHAGCCGGNA